MLLGDTSYHYNAFVRVICIASLSTHTSTGKLTVVMPRLVDLRVLSRPVVIGKTQDEQINN